jgi:hypothetical protein
VMSDCSTSGSSQPRFHLGRRFDPRDVSLESAKVIFVERATLCANWIRVSVRIIRSFRSDLRIYCQSVLTAVASGPALVYNGSNEGARARHDGHMSMRVSARSTNGWHLLSINALQHNRVVSQVLKRSVAISPRVLPSVLQRVMIKNRRAVE